MPQFNIVFERYNKIWTATCEDLRITLEDTSYTALLSRIKTAIQDIAEIELGYSGDIKFLITANDENTKIAV